MVPALGRKGGSADHAAARTALARQLNTGASQVRYALRWRRIMQRAQIGTSVLELVEGDITKQDTEAIANAANEGLRGGGGVDGAIHLAGGPQIAEECRKIGHCPTGEARITTGGRLKARWVIHTVGPVYHDGRHGEPELLAGAYRNGLQLASEKGIKTLAFPSISTGAYGYPMAEGARIALTTAIEYLRGHPEITLVRFVLFGSAALRTYEQVLAELMPTAQRD